MTITVDPVVGSTRVVVLASTPAAVKRPAAEFRRFGLVLVVRENIVSALAELVHDPTVLLVVSADVPCETLRDVLDLAVATSRSSVLLGLTAGADAALVAAAMEAGVRGTVELPLTPERLATTVRMLPLPAVETGPIKVGALTVDIARHRLAWDGTPIEVTPREFGVVLDLARRHPQVATLDELARGFNSGAIDPYAGVRVVITHVRSRLAAIAGASSAQVIETVRGVGYRLAL